MSPTLIRPEKIQPESEAQHGLPAGEMLDKLPRRKRFTRAEYHSLPLEVFQRDGHQYELIAGDIVEKMGQKEPHIGLLLRWLKALVNVFGLDNVRSQMPVVFADDTELEPDLSVASQTNDAYLAAGQTTPATDVRLIVEISVSSRIYDTETKALLYAKGSVPDYWVLDVAARELIVHRDPTSEGYATVFSLAETGTISPLGRPEATFTVGDYLP